MITSICQPHFFPWIGYFNMIHLSNKFIFLDNVQYNRRSWQNRVHIRDINKQDQKKYISLSIKNNSQSLILNNTFFYFESIEKIERIIFQNYKDYKFFKSINKYLLELINKNRDQNLANFNINIIKSICEYLEINLNYELSSKFDIKSKKEYLILELLKSSNSNIYLANRGSLNYANEEFFKNKGIKFYTHNFIHPHYEQISNKKLNFLENLSIIDLLFNLDKKSQNVVKHYTSDYI